MVAKLVFALLILSVGKLDVAESAAPANKPVRIEFGSSEDLHTSHYDIWHIEDDMANPGDTLFSWGSSLQVASTNITRLAGAVGESGYKNGEGLQARFSTISYFYQLGGQAIVIADRDNGCLRLLERNPSDVTSVLGSCSQLGHADGSKAPKFSRLGNFVRNKAAQSFSFYVADEGNNALRSFDYNKREAGTVATITKPRYLTYDVSNANFLYIAALSNVYHFDTATNRKTVIYEKASRSPLYMDGPFSQAVIAQPIAAISHLRKEFLIISETSSSALRLLDLQNKQMYTLCENGTVYRHTSKASPTCSFHQPRGLSHINDYLFIGAAGQVEKMTVSFRRVNDARNIVLRPPPTVPTTIRTTLPTTRASTTTQTTTVTTTSPPTTTTQEPCVPEDVTITLGPREVIKDVKVSKGETLQLGEGVHRYISNKGGVKCIKKYTIKKEPLTCPTDKITRVASAITGKATVALDIGSITQHMELPIGAHSWFIKTDDVQCTLNIVVYDGNVKRTMVFQADYEFECSRLTSPQTKTTIESVVNYNSIFVEEICGADCSVDKNKKPIFECKNDVLAVQYFTDEILNGGNVDIDARLRASLTQKLITKGRFMNIVDISAVPPLLFPKTTRQGASAFLKLVNNCANGKSYVGGISGCV